MYRPWYYPASGIHRGPQNVPLDGVLTMLLHLTSNGESLTVHRLQRVFVPWGPDRATLIIKVIQNTLPRDGSYKPQELKGAQEQAIPLITVNIWTNRASDLIFPLNVGEMEDKDLALNSLAFFVLGQNAGVLSGAVQPSFFARLPEVIFCILSSSVPRSGGASADVCFGFGLHSLLIIFLVPGDPTAINAQSHSARLEQATQVYELQQQGLFPTPRPAIYLLPFVRFDADAELEDSGCLQ